MANGRNSTVITVRINDCDIEKIKRRANRKGILFTEYIKWVLLRSHR